MEHCMKEVLVRTKPKDSFTLVVSDNSANIQTRFNPPLYIQANRSYELAMVNLETYYTFANIREGDNNSFKWSIDGGKTWTILHIPTGCYELKAAINAEIIRIHGNNDITILPNVNTLQCIWTVVGAKCKVRFVVTNSLASVLGFKRSIYGVGRHASENLFNIMSVNSILVHCNIIYSSYMLGIQAPVVYNFFPNAAPGQKILEAPHNLIYLPVTVDVISTLSINSKLIYFAKDDGNSGVALQGDRGPSGSSGLKGDSGDKGPVGSRGPTGKRGVEGPEGPPGKLVKWDLLEAEVELEHVMNTVTRETLVVLVNKYL